MPCVMPLTLRRLCEWLLFGVLFAVLAFHVVHSAADMLTHSCPATDTVFQQRTAQEICPDEQLDEKVKP